MKNSTLRNILWLTIFSISMGMLESAVVIYLRELYYPGGFRFPIEPIDSHVAIIELSREAATLLMLLAIGIIAGRNKAEKFGWFLFCFAVWDIFYYIFLKIFIGWPESFMTWDILFLIPVTWVSPVIAPVIVSLTMIILAIFISWYTDKSYEVKFGWLSLTLLITGSVVLVISFCFDYTRFMLEHYSLKELWSIPDKEALYNYQMLYIPQSFNWLLFWAGEFIILAGIVFFVKKTGKQGKA